MHGERHQDADAADAADAGRPRLGRVGILIVAHRPRIKRRPNTASPCEGAGTSSKTWSPSPLQRHVSAGHSAAWHARLRPHFAHPAHVGPRAAPRATRTRGMRQGHVLGQTGLGKSASQQTMAPEPRPPVSGIASDPNAALRDGRRRLLSAEQEERRAVHGVLPSHWLEAARDRAFWFSVTRMVAEQLARQCCRFHEVTIEMLYTILVAGGPVQKQNPGVRPS